MSVSQVESLTASLVREYLSRKGLKTTLRVMDEECPREENSISNRQLLVKELHIEKIMKRNKEQLQPLKAMLEVIINFLLDQKQKILNGEADPASRPVSRRATGRSAMEDNPYKPKEDNSVKLNLDSQNTFDGFPVAQQDDDDDLLKPDPNFKYPTYQKTRKQAAVNKNLNKQHSNDLVIEDSTEGETVLGHGKAGVLQMEEEDQLPTNPRTTQARPRSSAKHRGLGISGPITSTEDSSRRKIHKPRPLSATKNQRLNIFENNSSPKITSIDDTDTKVSPKIPEITSVKEIDTLLSSQSKKTIQDVLDVEKDRPLSSLTRRQLSEEKETPHYSVESSSIKTAERKARNGSLKGGSQSSSSSSINAVKVGDVEMGEIDDLDQDLAGLSLGPKISPGKLMKTHHNCKPIDVKTAISLKTLIFGTPMQSFSDEWRYQSFSFSDLPKLKYGIVQKKGGPCGVLASVQACVVQELLYGENKVPINRFSEVSYDQRSQALAIALAKIFWRAGERRKAIITLPSGRPLIGSGGKFRADELTETLNVYTFIDFEELKSFMKQAVNQFEVDGVGGVVLSLYSVILSRKIEGVKEDMDEPTNKLMGAHGYCTQDMVNLYLSGKAVSNVFNDVVELDSGDGNIMILKGVVSRCDVGLLSLFEHYKSCQVGTYLKTPRYPIWVVCSESHFSVLFCLKKDLTSDWKAEKRFDLMYYDGLARQQEEIRLTIDTMNRSFVTPSEDELVPPLEHCIRTNSQNYHTLRAVNDLRHCSPRPRATVPWGHPQHLRERWEGAEVLWNGTEPLL